MAEDGVEESLGTAQHYIWCAICEERSNFYCNDCQQSLCDHHQDIHLKKERSRHHEVVLYKDRTIPLPTEKCTIHQTRDLVIYCDSCSVPICSKCSTSNHRNHQTSDLEIVYNITLQQCKDQLTKIREVKLDSQKEQTEQDEERFNLTKSAMERRVSEIEDILDIVLSEKLSELGAIKESYFKETEKEISNIEALIAQHEYEMERALTKPSSLLKFHQRLISHALEEVHDLVTDHSTLPTFIKGIEDKKVIEKQFGELTKPSSLLNFHQRLISHALEEVHDLVTDHSTLPTFIKGIEDKKVIEKQFGEIKWPVKKLYSGPHEEAINLSQSFPPLSKEREAESRRTMLPLCDILGAPKIKFDVKKEGMMNIRTQAYHLSGLSSGNFWASNSWGDLILFDKKGNVLKKIPTNVVDAMGYHTTTIDGKILFIIAKSKAIFQVTSELNTSKIISCEEWEPGAIHSSHINGDILVGMNKNKEFKVTRFSKEGTKLQVIQKDEEGKKLYESITYITENINGDICTSDYTANSVVGVSRSGQHRFSYFGHQSQSGFHPNGVCTDRLGHILVCNSYCSFFGLRNYSSVHLLDMNGQFLSLLLSPDQCPEKPRALCLDDHDTLMVVGEDSATVTVYKYFQMKEN